MLYKSLEMHFYGLYSEKIRQKTFAVKLYYDSLPSRAGALNLYSLIYPLANFKSKIYSTDFVIFSLLQIPIVIGKSVNFLLTKFTPKAGQIYPWLRTPVLEGVWLFACN